MDCAERDARKKEFREHVVCWKKSYKKTKLNFNPVVTISTCLFVICVLIWIFCDKDSESKALRAQNFITDNFTWLYVSTSMGWVIYIVVIFFKFGDKKLGLDEEEPIHQSFAYFTMLFTCGVSSAIYYAAVSDPIGHYNSDFSATQYYPKETTAEKAQHAISITIFLWGLLGYASQVVFSLILGILAHRKGLPLTFRTCFYPLLGRLIFGRIGDIIDTICITSILYGVSVSLVIGAKFLASSLSVWNSNIDISGTNEIAVVWVLTILSTVSVISGLNIGIKKLSQVCFSLGAFILLILLTSYKTAHILNAIVQSFGFYVQYLVGFGTQTAAYEQLINEARRSWMNANTMFYWGWWISWSPFTGMFIARISRGRTIKEVISFSILLPTAFLFVWLVTYGTIALDLEMIAQRDGILCNGTKASIQRLSCSQPSFSQTFAMFEFFDDIKEVLQLVTVIGATAFFVTSSDSASLIVDCVSSNGDENPPVIQRVFWALCEGAIASALLQFKSKNNDDIPGLKAIAVLSGFPLTFLLCLCCYSLWRVLKHEPNWKIELEKVWESPIPTKYSALFFKRVFLTTCAPWFILGKISGKLQKQNVFEKVLGFVLPAAMFYFWIILLFASLSLKYTNNIGWSLIILYLCYGANIRTKIRKRYKIEGNILGDGMMMIVFPFTIMQMEKQLEKRQPSESISMSSASLPKNYQEQKRLENVHEYSENTMARHGYKNSMFSKE